MALPEISLAQFNRIAIGDYNAGFVDFKMDRQFIVHSPIVGNIDQHVNAIRQNGPAPALPMLAFLSA